MTGWLFLLFAVAGSTIIWPVARWGLGGDGRPVAVGFWTSLGLGGVSLVGWLARGPGVDGQIVPPVGVWIAGGVLAVAYAVGFWMLIMHALKIGPAGPTVTVNNMAMVCGVLHGVLILRPNGVPNPFVIAGAAGTCLALVLIGLGHRSPAKNGAQATPRRWLAFVLAGGAFSGLSFISQTYVGEVQRSWRFAFLAIGGFVSGFLLLVVLLTWRSRGDRREPIAHRREVIAGLSIGTASGVAMLLTLAAFAYLGSAIVLPFAVTTPVLLMLVIGHFHYHERLDRLQLAGCVVGAASVLLLALGSRGGAGSASGG